MIEIWKRMNKKRLFMIFLLIFAEASCMLLLPTLAAKILNIASIDADRGGVTATATVMLTVTLVTIALGITSVRLAAKESQGLGNHLRKAIFAKIISFSGKDFAEFETSTLITRTTNDIIQIQVVTMMFLRLIILSPIIMIVSAIFAYRVESQLAWVFAIVLPLLLVIIWLIFKFASPLFRSLQQKTDNLNKVFREGLTGIRVIRAFNTTDYENARFDEVNTDFRNTSIRTFSILNFMLPTMLLVVGLSNALIYTNGAHLVSLDQMQAGSLIAFGQYSVQILAAVLNISMILFFLPRAEVAAERVNKVLKHPVGIADPADPVDIPHQGEVTLDFDHVSFGFEGAERPAISDIDFSAKSGDTIAIIGGTGSGKTTIANLIPRLYEAHEGAVYVNGVDVRDVRQKDLRDMIGFTAQKAVLFSGTIRSNLLYGNPKATNEEMWEALEVAQADFVQELPDGLDSRVERGGTNFSGGQRQRLSIARTIVRHPDIYVFDDSFSALDFKTDSKLRAALRPITRDAISIIIAQRVNTVINADRILVLDNGRLVGSGTHEELLQSNEVYRDIVDSQMKGDDA